MYIDVCRYMITYIIIYGKNGILCQPLRNDLYRTLPGPGCSTSATCRWSCTGSERWKRGKIALCHWLKAWRQAEALRCLFSPQLDFRSLCFQVQTDSQSAGSLDFSLRFCMSLNNCRSPESGQSILFWAVDLRDEGLISAFNFSECSGSRQDMGIELWSCGCSEGHDCQVHCSNLELGQAEKQKVPPVPASRAQFHAPVY